MLQTLQPNPAEETVDEKPRYPLTASHLSQHDTEQEMEEKGSKKSCSKFRNNSSIPKESAAETIIVRIEVEDSGSGIKPSDMHKLFSKLNIVSHIFNSSMRYFSRVQPDRTRAIARWEGDWFGFSACATSCQIEWREARGAIKSWTGIDILGRTSTWNRKRSCDNTIPASS